MMVPLDVGLTAKLVIAGKKRQTTVRGWKSAEVILVDWGDLLASEASPGQPCQLWYLREGTYYGFKTEIVEVLGSSSLIRLLALRFPQEVLSKRVRSSPRIRMNLSGRVRDWNGEVWPCAIKDLSLGGCRAQVEGVRFDVGDRLELSCVLPTQEKIKAVLCTVRQAYGTSEYGFEFERLEATHRAALERLFVILNEVYCGPEIQELGVGMVGNLDEVPLTDVLHILIHSRKAFRLDLEGEGKTGMIFVGQGEVVNATAGQVAGGEALMEMFSWRKGRYRIQKTLGLPARNVGEPFEYLLLEWAHRIDQQAMEQS